MATTMKHYDEDGTPNFGGWREPLVHNVRNEEKAAEMFFEMQGIVKKWGHDYLGTRYMPDLDPMISTAIATVRNDTIRREEMHAASSVKNKFTSIYWREWNADVSLLQDMSAKDPPVIESAVNATRRRLKEFAKSEKKKKEKRGASYSFASPPKPKYSQSKMFDSHMMGNNTHVKFLTEKCLGEPFRVAAETSSNHYDPYALGNRLLKGGYLPQGAKVEKPTKLLTANCDCPPVDRVRSEKGAGKFLGSQRFSPIKDLISSTMLDDGDATADVLPSIFDKTVGPSFGTALRFQTSMSDIANAPPGPGTYDVLRLFDEKEVYIPDDAAVATANTGSANPVTTPSLVDDYDAVYGSSGGRRDSSGTISKPVTPGADALSLTQENIDEVQRSKLNSKGKIIGRVGLDVDNDIGTGSRGMSRGDSRGELKSRGDSRNSSKSNPTTKRLEMLVAKYNGGLEMINERKQDLAEIVGFGYGCSKEEHMVYGMCLDGMCGRRAIWETTMLTTNQYARACGFSDPNNKQMKNFSMDANAPFRNQVTKTRDKKVKNLVASEYADIIQGPVQHLSPIYIAAFRNDLDSIEKLKFRAEEINNIESATGYTPLHISTIRCLPQTVLKLLEVFHGHINVNIQDVNKDTPLHIAAKLGFKEIVAALCDNGADPRACFNAKKQLPMELSKDHAIFSIIQLTVDELNLREELKNIKSGFISGVSTVKTKTDQDVQEERWGGGGFTTVSRFKTVEGSDKVERTHNYDSNEFPKNFMGEDPPDQLDDSSPQDKSGGFNRRKLVKTTLKNPRNNSLMIGYWADTAEKRDSEATPRSGRSHKM